LDEELNRDQLIRLVERIIRGEGTEDEEDEWLDLIDRSVTAPTGYVSDLIFWSDRQSSSEEPSATEIVDKALVYKSICL